MLMRTTMMLIALLALFGSARLGAQTGAPQDNRFLTLRGLVNVCERKDPTSVAVCGAYITGFVGGSQAMQAIAVLTTVGEGIANGTVAQTAASIDLAEKKLNDQLRAFCIGPNWTPAQVQAVVLQYAREFRSMLDETSAEHMLNVLAKAFPCHNGK